MRAGRLGCDQGAVIAAGDDALTVSRARQDRAAVDGNALLAVFAGEQQRLLAEHKHRRLAKEMHAEDGATGVHRTNAVGERGKRGLNVAHAAGTFLPSPRSYGERVASAGEARAG